jgi:AmmeMemoRadiSam system protein A
MISSISHPFPSAPEKGYPPMTESVNYSESQKQTLLKLAYDSISSYLETHKQSDFQTTEAYLLQPTAVFVTLTIHGNLRGCVGQVFASKPLFAAIQDAALSAAFSDPRFPPLTQTELNLLHIKIAILSALSPIAEKEIEIGRHGLMIEHNFKRGLLLPEVASDHNWDRKTFLENLCYKASLPPDAWRYADQLLGFTTDVIEMKKV